MKPSTARRFYSMGNISISPAFLLKLGCAFAFFIVVACTGKKPIKIDKNGLPVEIVRCSFRADSGDLKTFFSAGKMPKKDVFMSTTGMDIWFFSVNDSAEVSANDISESYKYKPISKDEYSLRTVNFSAPDAAQQPPMNIYHFKVTPRGMTIFEAGNSSTDMKGDIFVQFEEQKDPFKKKKK